MAPLVDAKPAPRLDDKYELLSLLGTGSTGSVYAATDLSTGQLVALRLIPRTAPGVSPAHLEAALASHHAVRRHPHTISLKEIFLTPQHLCVAMEFATAGTLLAHIKNCGGRLPEATARHFLQQLLLAVDFCHRRSVHVRDLKLESLLLQPCPASPCGQILKLADFGPAAPPCAAPRVITLVYAAPETIRTADYDSHQADVWACGVVLYTMLAGTYPFQTPQGQPAGPFLSGALVHMLQAMEAHDVRLPEGVLASPTCSDLVHHMLDPDPASRLTLAEVMGHPWFTVDLPPSYAGYNDNAMLADTPEEAAAALAAIRKTVQQATAPAPKSAVMRPLAWPLMPPAAAIMPATHQAAPQAAA